MATPKADELDKLVKYVKDYQFRPTYFDELKVLETQGWTTDQLAKLRWLSEQIKTGDKLP